MSHIRAAAIAAGVGLLGATVAATGAMAGGSLKDAPAPFSWTGFYVGANAGYHWGADDSVGVSPADAATRAFWDPAISAGAQPTAISVDRDGFIGGAQLGYNMQTGSTVLGVEADISWLGGDSDKTVSNNGIGGFVPNTSTATHELEWLGTVRARAGWLAARNTLFYITGGLAYGRVNAGFSGNFNATNDHFSGSESKVETGWTIGGGLEYAFDRNWLLRGEYLYYDLGSTDFTTIGTGRAASVAAGNFVGSVDTSGHIARLGISYKF
jgi:outer membrane immunogenic protein